MNTKLILALSLGLGSLTPEAHAMNPAKKPETRRDREQREAHEAVRRRLEENRREQSEKDAQKKTQAQAANPVIGKGKEEADGESDFKEVMRKRLQEQREQEKQIQAPAAPELPRVEPDQMEPVPVKEIIPVEAPLSIASPRVEVLDEEETAPQPEPELSAEEIAAEQRAQASMRARDLNDLQRNIERIVTANEADRLALFMQLILGGDASRNAINTSLNYANYIIEKYANDPEFAPFIAYLNGMMLIDETIMHLIDAPHDIDQWNQLLELYTTLRQSTHVDSIGNCLDAQQASYAACRDRIFNELQTKEHFDPLALIDNVMAEAEAAQRRAQEEQLEQENATNEAIARLLAEQDLQEATANDANLAAELANQVNQGHRHAQEQAGLEEARRLQQEENARNRNQPMPPFVAPAPNDPEPNIPANQTSRFDLNSLFKNFYFLHGLVAATGASIVGYIAYKAYGWFTTKLEKAKAKRKVPTKNGTKAQARSHYPAYRR